VHLIGESLIGLVVPDQARAWLAETQRAWVDHNLDELAALANDSGLLVLAHIMAPHAPYVLDGSDGPGCWPRCNFWESRPAELGLSMAEYTAALVGQIRALNEGVLAAVDRILVADQDAVIVMFGDHGARYDLITDPDEAHRIFLAAHTPGHPRLFADEPHPDAILPALSPIR
jgi:hypothetical protein